MPEPHRPPAASDALPAPQAGFAGTDFDALLPPPSGPAARAPAAFDVCHAGVVLRAVLVVHAVLAVGVAFASAGFEAWLTNAALAASVAFPSLLLWLVAMCALKDAAARWPPVASTTVAAALGAASAAGCWLLQARYGLGLLADGRVYGVAHWPAAALAGAAFAALLVHWLRLRATGQAPADTSARLAELQSRIRPHFLFNTLNTAITLARVDPARTEGLLEDLAELFRVALAGSDAAVTLADEVELARRYLAIEQTRFGDRLSVAWELDAAAGAARLPPLLLQPLVENAVRHGVEPSQAGGAVRVRTRARRGHAVVTITNTVPDADEGDADVPSPLRPGAGIALANVRERLHLMHDVAAQFDARLEGGVWRVQIVLPLG